MGTCGACKFWGVITRDTYPNPTTETQVGEFRQCGRLVHDDDGHANVSDNFEADDWHGEARKLAIRTTRKELAVLQDGSGYFAALKSRSDFGCVLFEQKEIT